MKIGEVKGVRGLRKLMKEIAVTASTGKHDNELVGCATLPLKVLLLPAVEQCSCAFVNCVCVAANKPLMFEVSTVVTIWVWSCGL